MRRIFTSFAAIACLTAINYTSSAQTGCAPLNQQVCNDPLNLVATFPMTPPPGGETMAQGFTSTSFQAHQGAMTLTGIAASTTYSLNSAQYYTTPAPGPIQLGFHVSRNAGADVASITINIWHAGSNSIIGTCTITDPGGNANSFDICTAIQYDHTVFASSGLIWYEFIFVMDANVGGGNPTLQFDDFNIAGVTQAPLPVHYTNFSAKRVISGAQLTWTVDVEENVSGYEVEKSTDGRTFTKIGYVDATGAGTYTFIDTKLNGASFYRIKSLDIDGKYTYSIVVSLNGDKSSVVIKAFPSPAINDLTVQHEVAETNARITISTVDGKLLRSVIPSKGSQQTTISLASATPGMYIVRYDNGNGLVETIKIVKQ